MQKYSKSFAAIGCIAFGIIGCTAPNVAEISVPPASKSPLLVDLSKSCAVSTFPEIAGGGAEGVLSGTALVVAGAIVPVLTNYAFDQFVALAKAETLKHSASSVGRSTRQAEDNLFNDGELALGCLTIMRPSNEDSAVPTSLEEKMTAAKVTNWRAKVSSRIEAWKNKVETLPELYAEFLVMGVEAKTASGVDTKKGVAMYLKPSLLIFGGTAAEKTGREGAKDLSIAVEINGLVADKAAGLAEKSVYTHQIVLQDVPIGSVHTRDEAVLAAMSGTPVALPSGRFTYNDVAYETNVPLQAVVTVTETENKGDLARKAVEAVESKKDDIVGPFNERLLELLKTALDG